MAASPRLVRLQPWLLLVAFALVMRVFVPQGMMVEQADSGTITIEICNSDATWALPIKAKHSPSENKQAGSHCVFAGHGGGDLPPHDAAAYAAPVIAAASFAGFVSAEAAIASTRQLPPARAPPFLA